MFEEDGLTSEQYEAREHFRILNEYSNLIKKAVVKELGNDEKLLRKELKEMESEEFPEELDRWYEEGKNKGRKIIEKLGLNYREIMKKSLPGIRKKTEILNGVSEILEHHQCRMGGIWSDAERMIYSIVKRRLKKLGRSKNGRSGRIQKKG